MHSAFVAKVFSVREHRGAPRVWFESSAPERAGFEPGARFNVHTDAAARSVVLELEASGARTVSRKTYSSGRSVPVLDINSRDDLAPFIGSQLVKVVFTPGKVVLTALATEVRRIARLERLRGKLRRATPLATAGACAGGGVLSHAMHAGLADAGVATEIRLHNEARDDLVDQVLAHHELVTTRTCVAQLPLQELAFDDELLRRIGVVEVMELGLPCSGASLAGRAKRGLAVPESHPEVGHLAVAALVLVAKLNPVACLFENVVPYASTASAQLLRYQLRDLGYATHETELYGPDFGELEARRRWCMVAVTAGIDFSFAGLVPCPAPSRRLADVLESPDAPGLRWDEMQGLRNKQVRDQAASKNFKMQVYSGEEHCIGTLTKGISKNRSTDPKIQHPQLPGLLRVPTAREHARCKGVPEHLIAGLSHTKAHELLGQAVAYQPFRAVAKLLGRYLLAWLKTQPRQTLPRMTLKVAA